MELELQIVSKADVAIVRCHGRLIYGEEAKQLTRTLRQLLESTRQIVLQLAEVTQIDSGGVGVLGEIFMAAHNKEAEIKLAALSPRVAEVLRITGLGQLFDKHNSETEAIKAFLKPSRAEVTR